VGFLDDEQVLTHMDDALLSASPHLSCLMATLFDKGFRPHGQMPTFIFALSLMGSYYETIRMDGGGQKESFELAISLVLKHPVIQKFLAQEISNNVDAAAGVK
tara:strand:+ start:585 stop:893 length:309 start_codon:yes stop_codon:yes gene_type:complete